MSSFHICVLLNNIPHCFTERRMVDGKEQVCLVLPADSGQLFRTKRGEYFIKGVMNELSSVESDGTTHRFRLFYHSPEEARQAERGGWKKRSNNMGKMCVWSEHPERNINYKDNPGTDIYIKGAICLDDIQGEDTILDAKTGRRTLKCIFRNNLDGGTPIFLVGEIVLSDITPSDTIMNPRTGKHNVPCAMKKSERMDRLLNTHSLVVTKADGSEIEIGRFREYKEATKIQQRVATAAAAMPANPNEPQKRQPEEESRFSPPEVFGEPKVVMIDGYKL